MNAGERSRRASIFGSIFVHTSIDVERPSANVKYRWMVKDRWKLIVPHLPNRDLEIWEKIGRLSWMRDTAELFDIVADPTEKKDLAAVRPEVVKQLTAELDRWWKPV